MSFSTPPSIWCASPGGRQVAERRAVAKATVFTCTQRRQLILALAARSGQFAEGHQACRCLLIIRRLLPEASWDYSTAGGHRSRRSALA